MLGRPQQRQCSLSLPLLTPQRALKACNRQPSSTGLIQLGLILLTVFGRRQRCFVGVEDDDGDGDDDDDGDGDGDDDDDENSLGVTTKRNNKARPPDP